MSDETKTIEIKDLGPIEIVSIPIPAEGGPVVFHGRNGSGKTTAIRGTTALLGGDKRGLTVRDGKKTGSVSGLGITLRVARSATRLGELEVETLRGKSDVTDLINPGQKDPALADAARLKAMISLGGFQATPTLFTELFEDQEQFDAVVPPQLLDTDDLMEMARRVKAAIEKASRDKKTDATSAQASADACRKAAEGVDVKVEHDAETLSRAVERALEIKSCRQRDIEHAQERANSVSDAQELLDQAVADYRGIGPEEARTALGKAELVQAEAHQRLNTVEKAIEQLRNKHVLLTQECSAAIDTQLAAKKIRNQAVSHQEAIVGWRMTIEDAVPQGNEAALEVRYKEAVGVLNRAREAMEEGVAVRSAIQQLEDAAAHSAKAETCRGLEATLREAAKGTYPVLTKLIEGGAITVRGDGRLVTVTERGETLFHELSDGERTRLGLDYAIRAIGPGGLFELSQEYWQGLDHENRCSVREQLVGTKVVMATAQADDGDLRAEVFEG